MSTLTTELQMIGNGEGIHWPDLDEDISVENVLFGQPSGESQRYPSASEEIWKT